MSAIVMKLFRDTIVSADFSALLPVYLTKLLKEPLLQQLGQSPIVRQDDTRMVLDLLQTIKTILSLIEENKDDENNKNFPLVNVYSFLNDVLNGNEILEESILQELVEILAELCNLTILMRPDVLPDLWQLFVHHFTQVCEDDLSEYKLKCSVTIINSMLEKLKSISSEDFHSYFEKMISPVELNAFKNLLHHTSNEISGISLLKTLPLYVNFFKRSELCVRLSQNILEKSVIEWKDFAIVRSFVNVLPESTFLSLIDSDNFWSLIQKGLCHEHFATRKQALCLCKTIVVGFPLKHLCKHNQVFWWDQNLNDALHKTFSDIFLILETAEEKQSHLVKPVFKMLSELSQIFSTNFPNMRRVHCSWLLITYRRLLEHDNTIVKKSALSHLMNLDVEIYSDVAHFDEAIRLILNQLRSPTVFYNDSYGVLREVTKFFQTVASSKRGPYFMKIFIKMISEMTWCAESLYLVLHATEDIPPGSYWSSEELEYVKIIARTRVTTMYRYIRCAIQFSLVELLTRFLETVGLKLEELADVLVTVASGLAMGTRTWKCLVRWVTIKFDYTCAEEYVTKNLAANVTSRKFAMMLHLLSDAQFIDAFLKDSLRKMVAEFEEANKYDSLDDIDRLESTLQLVNNIMEMDTHYDSCPSYCIIKCFDSYFSNIDQYILARARNINENTCPDQLDIYVDIIASSCRLRVKYLYSTTTENEWRLFICDVLKNEDCCQLQLYFAISVLVFYSSVYAIPWDALEYLKKNFLTIIKKPVGDGNGHEYGRINSKFLSAKCAIVESIVRIKVGNNQFLSPEQIIFYCHQLLKLGDSEVLKKVMELAKTQLPSMDIDDVESFVDVCWQNLMETRKCDTFLNTAFTFVAMLFHEPMFEKSAVYLRILLKYAKLLLEESNNGLAWIFVSHLSRHSKCRRLNNELWCPILSEAMLFGPLLKREDRLIKDTYDIIRGPCNPPNNCKRLTSPRPSSSVVRGQSISIAIQYINQYRVFDINPLIEREAELTKKKTRYYANSRTHLYRTRLLQALLILLPILEEEQRKTLFNWACENLVNSNEQPSVRYLRDYLLFMICFTKKLLVSSKEITYDYNNGEFFQRVVNSANNPAGYCCIISLAYLLARSNQASFNYGLNLLLPHCFAHNFNVRLHAQLAVQSLLKNKSKASLSEAASALQDPIDRVIAVGKSQNKISDNFFFSTFCPVDHYSVQTILYDIPRLAGMEKEEFISAEEIHLSDSVVPIFPKNNILRNYHFTAKLPILRSIINDNDKEESSTSSDNIQKKLIPGKSLMSLEELYGLRPKKKDGLIVVASLLDSAANLGGLARTCEIFGVSELVVNTLHVVKDSLFQNLSVTAEKWIQFSEVKPHDLSDYLLRKKNEGYCVIGAEQTVQSSQLQKTVFPQKCLLLLGNEKEGMPADFLPLLDLCVEVPQLGFVRSLNVHVTGALFIWEYAKQHEFMSS